MAIPHYMSGGNPPNILTHVYKSFGGFMGQSVTSHLTEYIYLYLLYVYSSDFHIEFLLFKGEVYGTRVRMVLTEVSNVPA
jgi:hypothetical protein